jgi:hypothetical protein
MSFEYAQCPLYENLVCKFKNCTFSICTILLRYRDETIIESFFLEETMFDLTYSFVDSVHQ